MWEKFVAQMLPKHKIFVEVVPVRIPFFLHKPLLQVEVYNDLDLRVINFFQILRERFDEFVKASKGLDVPEDIKESWLWFEDIKKICQENWFYVTKVLVKGSDTLAAKYLKNYLKEVDWLPQVAQRLLWCSYEYAEDFNYILKTWKKFNALFFVQNPANDDIFTLLDTYNVFAIIVSDKKIERNYKEQVLGDKFIYFKNL